MVDRNCDAPIEQQTLETADLAPTLRRDVWLRSERRRHRRPRRRARRPRVVRRTGGRRQVRLRRVELLRRDVARQVLERRQQALRRVRRRWPFARFRLARRRRCCRRRWIRMQHAQVVPQLAERIAQRLEHLRLGDLLHDGRLALLRRRGRLHALIHDLDLALARRRARPRVILRVDRLGRLWQHGAIVERDGAEREQHAIEEAEVMLVQRADALGEHGHAGQDKSLMRVSFRSTIRRNPRAL